MTQKAKVLTGCSAAFRQQLISFQQPDKFYYSSSLKPTREFATSLHHENRSSGKSHSKNRGPACMAHSVQLFRTLHCTTGRIYERLCMCMRNGRPLFSLCVSATTSNPVTCNNNVKWTVSSPNCLINCALSKLFGFKWTTFCWAGERLNCVGCCRRRRRSICCCY